jgi:hypothetical protein
LWWYNFDKLNQARCIIASIVFGHLGGASSTSILEDLLHFCYWSSVLLLHQVVRPWWLGGVQRRQIFIRRGHSSNFPLILGDDALRTLASGGGGT